MCFELDIMDYDWALNRSVTKRMLCKGFILEIAPLKETVSSTLRTRNKQSIFCLDVQFVSALTLCLTARCHISFEYQNFQCYCSVLVYFPLILCTCRILYWIVLHHHFLLHFTYCVSLCNSVGLSFFIVILMWWKSSWLTMVSFIILTCDFIHTYFLFLLVF